MKENSLESHRGKVAESKAGAAAKQETTSATNFDDDYNEWELGIGDLIIDLDADIEKNNEKSVSVQNSGGGHQIVQQQTTPTTFSMASTKGGRINSTAVEHHATVDKGLKMKIKRTKPTKTSEAKHEIVKSDTKPASPVETLNGSSGTSATVVDSKSKHISSKGRGGSHREKRERTKDKDKNVNSKSGDVNGVMTVMPSSTVTSPTTTIKLSSNNVNMTSISSPTVNLGIPTSVVSLSLTSNSNSVSYTTTNSGQHSGSSSNQQTSMPTISVKLDNKYPTVPLNNFSPTVKTEDISRTVSAKRMRINNPEKPVEKVDRTTSPKPPEMHDICIGTSVGTITEPECLGPCEPGTSVTLEGIVWHETEGGVLVVNVTWRGKTYVGTLLDCTKHDWAPPRFCESPTSDVETRTPKGRGKRGRATSNNTPVDMSNYTETRSSVHSKLRNAGKGRRANNNSGFQAPPSPAKSDNTTLIGMKRKGRPVELEIRESELRTTKRSRSQSRGTPTNSTTPPEQPSSPVLIECPKPNCKKRYRHINGLRYHQTHAHHGSGSGVEDSLDEQTKDSSDNDESIQDSASVPQSPGTASDKTLRSSPRPFTGKTPAPPERKSTPATQTTTTNGSSEVYNSPSSTPVSSDLSTLASVAISDSKNSVKLGGVLRFGQSSPNPSSTTESESPKVPNSPSSSLNNVTTTSATLTTPTISIQTSQRNIVTNPNSPVSQVYQFTHAPVGSLTTTTVSTVRSPTTSTVPVTASNVTSTTSVGSPPAMSVAFSTTALTDKQKIKQEKVDKFKLKAVSPSTARPSVSSCTTQIIGTSSTVTSVPSTIMASSVVVHANVAATLKPIQPKAVVLNDVVPQSDGTKKEKTKHKKKSKDKDKERKSGEVSPSQSENKATGLETIDNKLNGTVYSKMSEIIVKDNIGEPVSPHIQNANYPIATLPRSVDSPLEVNTTEGNNTANENVQSPAYSDISDANDTAPVLESEVPSKDKEEDKVKAPSEPTPPPAHNLPPYQMYYSYRQPPYLVPSVPPQTSTSQAVPAATAPAGEKAKDTPIDKLENRIKEQQKQWAADKERVNPSSTASEGDKKETPANSANVVGNQSNMSEYQMQQQKLIQQQYTYPYGFSYPYSMDPAYHMQYMPSEPHLKQQLEKCMEERFYKDQFDRPKEIATKDVGDKIKTEAKAESTDKRKSNPPEMIKHSSSQIQQPVLSTSKEREQRPSSQSTKTIESANSSLKEKQNENHQILKENIELKTQMENKAKYDRYESSLLYQPEEMRRYFQNNYFHEKYLEQHKNEEIRRKEENATSKSAPIEKTQGPTKELSKPPTSSHNSFATSSPKSSGSSKEQLITKENIKKEIGTCESSKVAENIENKDKRETDRPKQQEGQKPTMETQGPPPPTSSYAYMHPSYMQSSPYSPISFDHSMYRNMLMTPGPYPSSPYLHPQMRYVPPNEHQTDMSPKLHSNPPPKALELLQHHAQYYTHKIHELQERALKSPPPSLSQSATASSKTVDSNIIKSEPTGSNTGHERRSPPLQRHLHTHHHTHVGVGYPIIGQYDPYGGKPLIRH